MSAIVLLPIGLGIQGMFSNAYSVTDKIATVQFGEKNNFIRISTVLMKRRSSSRKEKGVYIMANEWSLSRKMRQRIVTVKLSEEDIKQVINKAKTPSSFFADLGQKPRVTLSKGSLTSNIFLTIYYNKFMYSDFSAKADRETIKNIGQAFEKLIDVDASVGIEM